MIEMIVGTPDGSDRTEISDPTASEVSAAVSALDGRREMELIAVSGGWLSLAGNGTQFFAAFTPSADSDSVCQVRGDGSAHAAQFMVGGQPSEISARYVLDEATAQRVAAHFLRTGERLPSVDWDEI